MLRNVIFRLFVLVTLLTSFSSFAQFERSGWILEGGFNFIDDSGTAGAEPFNYSSNWNSFLFPSRFSLGYQMQTGWKFQGFISYNQYKTDVLVDGAYLAQSKNYYAMDALAGFGFHDVIDRKGWFDPFLQSGMGVARIGGNDRVTFNAGLGFNFWFSDQVAFNLSTMGKWGLGNFSGDNHIQHSFGMVIKPDFKALFAADKGEGEQLVLAEVTESIPENAKNELVVQEISSPGTVSQPGIAEYNSAINSEADKHKQALLDLSAVSRVHFEPNSAFIEESEYIKLNALINFLLKYPDSRIEIRGSTDRTGSAEYNAWLSLKRANTIKVHLINRGVAPARVDAVAKISDHQDLPCSDEYPCNEEELRNNRSVIYVLLSDQG